MFEETLLPDPQNRLGMIAEIRLQINEDLFEMTREWRREIKSNAPLEISFRAVDLMDRFLISYKGDQKLNPEQVMWAAFMLAAKLTRAKCFPLKFFAKRKDYPQYIKKIREIELLFISALDGDFDFLTVFHYLQYFLQHASEMGNLNEDVVYRLGQYAITHTYLVQTFSSLEIALGVWSLFADEKSWEDRPPSFPHSIVKIRDFLQQKVAQSDQNFDLKKHQRVLSLSIPRWPRRHPCEPLPMKMKDLTLLKVLGQGVNGLVHLYQTRSNRPKKFAVKKFHCDEEDVNYSQYGVASEFLRDLSVTRRNDSLQLISLCGFDYLPEKKSLYMILEYGGYSLHEFIYNSDSPLQKNRIDATRLIAFQILSGLHSLHQRGYLHRDLKPANVVLKSICVGNQETYQVQLIDFGLAKQIRTELRTPRMVTLWYRPPEISSDSEYDEKTDIWSLGCIIVEMLKGDSFLATDCGEDEDEKHLAHIKEVFSFDDEGRIEPRKLIGLLPVFAENRHLLDLLAQIFVFNPKERISARDAMNHPFFAVLQKAKIEKNI